MVAASALSGEMVQLVVAAVSGLKGKDGLFSSKIRERHRLLRISHKSLALSRFRAIEFPSLVLHCRFNSVVYF